MNMRTAVILTAALFFVLTLNCYGQGGPPEFTCAEVPFGASTWDVLKKFEGAEVTKKDTPYIESIGNYVIEGYFEGGLQEDDSGICFLPSIVKKYTVRSQEWKLCEEITLYFGGFQEGATDYELFMIKKTGAAQDPEADFKEVFEKLAGELDKEINADHKVDQGRIQSFDEETHTFYLPALVGTWDANGTLAFLMVANSPNIGPLPPEIVYISKPALKRYLEICKTY